jgi:RecA-family ATPase
MHSELFTDLPAEEFLRSNGNTEVISIEPTVESYAELGLSWRELSKREFTNTEKILFGLMRGNVGTMFAVTNLGKTTLALNICLSLAAGRTFEPFVKGSRSGCRVMVIDGESTQPELQADLQRMMRDWSPQERELVGVNLHIICDQEINEEPLNLSNPMHMAAVIECAQRFQPDLIVVDTLSALFTLRSENDNAEIKNVVMQPLKKMAKDANAALWLLHHIGKQNEDGQATVGAYSGRGGSNIGALARTVVLLKPDKHDPERVVFSIPKAKGFRLQPLLMRLDTIARWFTTSNETPLPQPTNYELVISTVKSFGRLVKRKEIDTVLTQRMSKQTITRNLEQAQTRGDLVTPKYSFYCVPELADLSEPETVEEAGKVM